MNVVVVLQQLLSYILHQHGLTTSWCDSERQRLLMDLGELLLQLGLVFRLWRLLLVPICASRQLGAACEAAAEPRDVTSCPAFQGLKENRYRAALSSLASLCCLQRLLSFCNSACLFLHLVFLPFCPLLQMAIYRIWINTVKQMCIEKAGCDVIVMSHHHIKSSFSAFADLV